MGSSVPCGLIDELIEGSSEEETSRNDRLLTMWLLRRQDRPPYELSDMTSADLKHLDGFLAASQAH